jgi:hypothetical protein
VKEDSGDHEGRKEQAREEQVEPAVTKYVSASGPAGSRFIARVTAVRPERRLARVQARREARQAEPAQEDHARGQEPHRARSEHRSGQHGERRKERLPGWMPEERDPQRSAAKVPREAGHGRQGR